MNERRIRWSRDHVIAFGFDTNFDTNAPNRSIPTEIDLFGTSV